MPLIRGGYPVTHHLKKFTGGLANAVQSDIPARSNQEWLGFSGAADTASTLTTAVAKTVPVPVEIGDVISKVTVLVGATAAGTPVNQWAALYSGITTPALMGESTDTTTAAIAASAAYTWTLATPQLITPTNAPNGFIYVSVMVKATTVPSLVTQAIPSAVQTSVATLATGAPLFLTATNGSALTGTAPATVASPSVGTTAPLVYLT